MKKFRILLLVFLGFILTGCSLFENPNDNFTNEIYNKSYNVETITIIDLENNIQAACEKASGAVLGITAHNLGAPIGTGSGVVYQGTIYLKNGTTKDIAAFLESDEVDHFEYKMITNRHVVTTEKGVKVSKVQVYDGDLDTNYNATILGTDNKVDLAVISFSSPKYIRPLEFADSDLLKQGQFAIALGSPEGYEFYNSATFGIISHAKRYLADDTDNDGTSDWDAEYIQHDVAINPGNSGGALINLEGKLVGINTLKLASTEIEGMGFAIPSNLVKKLIPFLERGETPVRYVLGINVMTVRDIVNNSYSEYIDKIPEGIDSGIYIAEVSETGLSHGKLQADDIILKFNGVEIVKSYEFRSILGSMVAGSTAVFEVYRNGQIIEVRIDFE
ncbi:MAG TPA: trypsin-like peptidase domain-containing protein [Bacilli bacterium]|nr:trypsin-like peptidase domain-containing protein [Bacilli bacterium]